MNVITYPAMPPRGVVDVLVPEVDSVDRLRFWLMSYKAIGGERLWRTVVLQDCLPNIEHIKFESMGVLLPC